MNEKVEGFFDACALRGLTGDQGAVIPISNTRDLMLRRDVVDAAEAGRFHLYPVATVDEALEVLTGRPAGTRDLGGTWPDGTVNAMVEARLAALADTSRAFASGESSKLAAGRERPARPTGRGRPGTDPRRTSSPAGA